MNPARNRFIPDPGYILLGDIIERLTGKPHDQLAPESASSRRCACRDTLFNPPKSLVPRIAPTEHDRQFRKRLLRGEGARRERLGHGRRNGSCRNVRNRGGPRSVLSDAAQRRHLRASTVAAARYPCALYDAGIGKRKPPARPGWTVPTANSSSGRHFSSSSFGHTGFHRHVAMDRPPQAVVRCLADQSREPHPATTTRSTSCGPHCTTPSWRGWALRIHDPLPCCAGTRVAR